MEPLLLSRKGISTTNLITLVLLLFGFVGMMMPHIIQLLSGGGTMDIPEGRWVDIRMQEVDEDI